MAFLLARKLSRQKRSTCFLLKRRQGQLLRPLHVTSYLSTLMHKRFYVKDLGFQDTYSGSATGDFMSQAFLDQEYLGGTKSKNWDMIGEEDFTDLIIDGPIEPDYRFQYAVREIPEPTDFPSKFLGVFLMPDDVLWMFDIEYNLIRVFDIEKMIFQDPIIFPQPLKDLKLNFDGTEPADGPSMQMIQLSTYHFVIWERKFMGNSGRCWLVDFTGEFSITPLNVDLSVVYTGYSRIFSLNKQLILQTRFAPTRDFPELMFKEEAEKNNFHKQHNFYTPESLFSRFFIYDFEKAAWKYLNLKGKHIPVVYSMATDTVTNKAYFFSSWNQGYCLDANKWSITPLRSIGRPKLQGSSMVVTRNTSTGPRIFSIGCFHRYISTNFNPLNTNEFFAENPWAKYIPVDARSRRIGTKFIGYRKYAKEITYSAVAPMQSCLVYDIKRRMWVSPTIEGWDKVPPMGDPHVVVAGTKIFVFRGRTSAFGTSKLYIFDELPIPDEQPHDWVEPNSLLTPEYLEKCKRLRKPKTLGLDDEMDMKFYEPTQESDNKEKTEENVEGENSSDKDSSDKNSSDNQDKSNK